MPYEDQNIWQCGAYTLSLARPRIMGVLNVTPDSFSDAGESFDTKAAVARGLKMLDEGADIIDVGGESTRPDFTPISSEEEAERIVPVIRELIGAGAIVSVDTRHADVAKMCVRLGAAIINDVTGFTDPAMVDVAASTQAGCVIMHAGEVSTHVPRRSVTLDAQVSRKSVDQQDSNKDAQDSIAVQESTDDEISRLPESDRLEEVMQKASRGITNPTVTLSSGNRRFTVPDEGPIMRQVMGFLGDQARSLMRAGVAQNRICVDPGAGFGKYADEDVVIQRATQKMVSMGYPVMCAISRKRFVGAISGVDEAKDRDSASIGVALAAAQAGARILRVHDVADLAQTLTSYWTIAHPDARRAFISLGSSEGDRLSYLEKAVALIDQIPLTCVVNTSRAYESKGAYGLKSTVANAVVEVRSELAPLVLLDALLAIEDELGRTRPSGKQKTDRSIDCDLLWMDGEIHTGSKLTLPHPGIGERDFVLIPLEDLMHDPVRFLTHAGIAVKEPAERVGRVIKELGALAWS